MYIILKITFIFMSCYNRKEKIFLIRYISKPAGNILGLKIGKSQVAFLHNGPKAPVSRTDRTTV
jgi:hypothetical protein